MRNPSISSVIASCVLYYTERFRSKKRVERLSRPRGAMPNASSPGFPGMPAGEQGRESLSELIELARSAGAEIAGTVFQLRDTADPATLVGRGKLDEIRAEATAHKAPIIIFDSNLSPMQQRNIEEATERRVIDRTQLILDIFARHARSPQGQLQVELAQLNHLLPRPTGKGTAM